LNTAKIKQKLRQNIIDRLKNIEGVISVTIVGSFVNQEDLTGISDIDTVVICKSLNNSLYQSCIDVASKINLKKCGLDNYNLEINPTFGPLKFDRSNLAVIHLMIYDVDAHKRHVLSSPFTCFDWERSETFVGPRLNEIFPVGMLQLRDFLEVRRSMKNYLDDLSKNVISYYEYYFDDKIVVEKKKYKKLDDKHRGEYTYHIVRNLVANYMKLRQKNNNYYSNDDIKKEIIRLFPKSKLTHSKKFDTISKIKLQRADSFPSDSSNWAKTFVLEFQKKIKEEWSNAVPIHFIRHFETDLNNGTYLGQGRDPGIDVPQNVKIINEPSIKIFSSPSRRCVETAQAIYKDMEIMMDERLLEFDYGQAEGLSYKQLAKEYPQISTGWQNGEDPRFPDGESTKDVYARLTLFLKDIAKSVDNNQSKLICVVTHNGVLRCLLGDAFGLDLNDWYKLFIPHGVPLEFLYCENRFYPNIPRNLWGNILQNIGYAIS